MATASTSNAVDFSDDAELKLFHDAVHDVLEDEGFHLQTPQASEALEAALSILEWSKSDENRVQVSSFSKALVRHLRNCLPDEMDRGKLWHNFHAFRSSKDHLILWNTFLTKSIRKGGPIFFQYITSHIFKQLIKQRFPAPTTIDPETAQNLSLSYEEANALRYAAGYIPRNLLLKVQRSGRQNKRSLRVCLLDIIEEDGMGDEDSQDWIKLVDRGGLSHVNSEFFKFVSGMELIVKAFLRREEKPREIRSELCKLIRNSETVLELWRTVSAEWEPEESELIFTMVTELWVTMRGFSYASAWMEKWKQETKKSVQKSQALRKKLNKN